MERTVNPGEIMVSYGYVAEGYEYPMLKFTVISETDIFGKRRKRRNGADMRGRRYRILRSLSPGIMSFTRIMDWESTRGLKKSRWIRSQKTI